MENIRKISIFPCISFLGSVLTSDFMFTEMDFPSILFRNRHQNSEQKKPQFISPRALILQVRKLKLGRDEGPTQGSCIQLMAQVKSFLIHVFFPWHAQSSHHALLYFLRL